MGQLTVSVALAPATVGAAGASGSDAVGVAEIAGSRGVHAPEPLPSSAATRTVYAVALVSPVIVQRVLTAGMAWAQVPAEGLA